MPSCSTKMRVDGICHIQHKESNDKLTAKEVYVVAFITEYKIFITKFKGNTLLQELFVNKVEI